MRHEFSRVVARNSASSAAAQIVVKLLSFSFSVLVVRRLGPESFGEYAAVLAFGAVFVFFSDLGLSPYIVREVARLRSAADNLGAIETLYADVVALRVLLSVVTAAMIVGSAWLTHRPPEMVASIALGTIGLLFYAVQGSSAALLSGFERLDLGAVAGVLNQLVFVLAGAAALWFGLGYRGLIVASLFGVAAMTYYCWRSVRRLGVLPHGLVAHRWVPLLRASFPFGLIGLALGLSYKFDSVLLSIFRGDVETGYYNAAYQLIFSAVVLSNVMNTALYPSLARQAVSEPQSLPRIYERALKYLVVLSLPIAVGGWVLSDRLIPFLFTAAYSSSAPVLRILVWVVPLMYASEFLGYVVVVQGKEARVARAVLLSTAVNVALNLVMVPLFGFRGAAIMTVATEAVLVVQYVWVLRTMLGQFNWSQILLRPLLAALAMGGSVMAVPELPVPVAVVVGGLLYGGLLLALRVLGNQELALLRGVLRRGSRQRPPAISDLAACDGAVDGAGPATPMTPTALPDGS